MLHSASGSWRSNGAHPADAACLVGPGGPRELAPWLACTPQHEFLPVQGRRMCLIERVRTLTTKKTPWPRGGPRCSAQALLGRAFQSIEDRLHHDKCHAVSQPLLFRIPHCSTSSPAQDATGSQEASVPTWNSRMLWRFLRKQRTGTFVTSPEPELRTSCDISQWTDRYWIADGRSRAPCASMNFNLVISTRSHDSSPARSTQMVPEKVHDVPFTRKF